MALAVVPWLPLPMFETYINRDIVQREAIERLMPKLYQDINTKD
jgi:hypothetical protein